MFGNNRKEKHHITLYVYLCQKGYIFSVVYLSTCYHDYTKPTKSISKQLDGRV